VLCGGAAELAARRVRDKLVAVAAHLLGADAAAIELAGREARAGDAAIPIAELARTCHLRPDLLPPGMDPIIEESATYAAEPGSGTFANGAHLAVVEVDAETGLTRVLRYVAVSDCGRMINPMVVDGQIHGGICQGLGGALCEELVYDEAGNPLSTTLLDYQLPNATDIPDIEVVHIETPSPFTRKGMKGVGEGGTIAPAAAVASAVEDALSPLGRVFVGRTPLTPERVLEYIDAAGEPQVR
jgi:carbon-monoxide dehydrogenase large subunit